MKLFLCPNQVTKEHLETARRCIDRLEKLCMAECFLSPEDSRLIFGDDSHSKMGADACDLIVAVGGDGSVLRAAKKAVMYAKPLVGINSGRLGYLCAIELSDVDSLNPRSFEGLRRSARSLIGFRIDGEEHFSVNDVVIAKSNFGATVEVEVLYRGEKLGSWRGDGVVIATPTGSTSYNLSAGGPVLLPDCGSFVITPICSHSVDTYPIVVSDGHPITVRVKNGSYNNAKIYSDGVYLAEMCEDGITVGRFSKELDLLVGDRLCVRLGKEKK